MKQKVSIIIPVYNGEEYLEDTISSILSSSYPELEVVVVNDGSTDRSLEICQKMQEKDNRIFIYTKPNEGVVAARNYGVEKVTGDYLCFCDQDDIVAEETYEKLVQSIVKDKSDFSMCSTGRMINGNISEFEVSEDACYNDDDVLSQLLLPLVFNGFDVPVRMSKANRYPNIWSCMFRMDFWRAHHFKFRAYISFEDDLLVKVDALTKAACVSTISYVGYYWRVNLKSESYAHRYVEDMALKQQQCFQDMYKCFSERIKEGEVLSLFKQVTMCKQYLDAVHNLASPYHKKTILSIRVYFKQSIYGRDFEQSIQACKYVKRGRIKPMVLLAIISRKYSVLTYFAEVVLDYLLFITMHSHKLTKMERLLKRRYN